MRLIGSQNDDDDDVKHYFEQGVIMRVEKMIVWKV